MSDDRWPECVRVIRQQKDYVLDALELAILSAGPKDAYGYLRQLVEYLATTSHAHERTETMSDDRWPERAAAVAYVLEEGDRYETGDGVVSILEELARRIADGEHVEAAKHGELDDWTDARCVKKLLATTAHPPGEPAPGPNERLAQLSPIHTAGPCACCGIPEGHSCQCYVNRPPEPAPPDPALCAADAVCEAVGAWEHHRDKECTAHIDWACPECDRLAHCVAVAVHTARIRPETEVRAEERERWAPVVAAARAVDEHDWHMMCERCDEHYGEALETIDALEEAIRALPLTEDDDG